MKNTYNSNTNPTPRGKRNDYHGSHWIRQERRLALYLRDGLACCYCNSSIEDGATLSLDHVIPYSKGGTNLASNLVTSCTKCNCSRGDRSIEDFTQAVATYLDATAAQILSHIHTTTKRPVDISAAKALIARRGSYQAALHKEE